MKLAAAFRTCKVYDIEDIEDAELRETVWSRYRQGMVVLYYVGDGASYHKLDRDLSRWLCTEGDAVYGEEVVLVC